MKRIESKTNPFVKTLKRLAHPKKREEQFLLEGKKLVDAALTSAIDVETIVVSTAFSEEPPSGTAVVELPDPLFRSVSTLASPEGILAVARRPPSATMTSGLVAVAAGIQDPGNLGAVARVVEAAGAAGLVVLRGSTDPFGPKAVRGSMGSLLRVPVAEASTVLELDGFRMLALVPRGGTDYRDADWKTPCAVVLGGESTGLDEAIVSACSDRITIPMQGKVDSLNVATAAALALYEAVEQLNAKAPRRKGAK